MEKIKNIVNKVEEKEEKKFEGKKKKSLWVQYRFTLIMLVAITVLLVADRSRGLHAVNVVGFSMKEMLLVIPPIFILLGLLDVWVPRKTMVKHMGEDSGIKGMLLAFAIGSFAAGPLYGAFPVAAVLMKKGAKFSNVLIFLGAWSTTKIPMFLFEIAALGSKFAVSRLIIDIPGIIIIAYIVSKFLSDKEKAEIYKKAEESI